MIMMIYSPTKPTYKCVYAVHKYRGTYILCTYVQYNGQVDWKGKGTSQAGKDRRFPGGEDGINKNART